MILHSKKELDVYMTGFDVPYVPQRRMKGTSCRTDEECVSNAIKNIKRSNHMDRKQLEAIVRSNRFKKVHPIESVLVVKDLNGEVHDVCSIELTTSFDSGGTENYDEIIFVAGC